MIEIHAKKGRAIIQILGVNCGSHVIFGLTLLAVLTRNYGWQSLWLSILYMMGIFLLFNAVTAIYVWHRVRIGQFGTSHLDKSIIDNCNADINDMRI
jgi:hypothetical protein